MYLSHYGLALDPFTLSPNLKFLFLSRAHEETIAHLIYGLEHDEDIVLITGDIGTGKTMALHSLVDQIPGTFVPVVINLTTLNFDQLLRLVLRRADRDVASGDRADLVDSFERLLLEQREKTKKVLLIIDEAQNLSSETLESIRLLLNLAQPGSQVLQLILVGQLSLADVMARPDLRQLRQRIRVHYQLEPLARGELQEYVEHRLRVAGREEPLVTAKALDRIYELSGGIPRQVNHLVSKALLSGFVDEAKRIEEKHVDVEGLLDLPVTEPRPVNASVPPPPPAPALNSSPPSAAPEPAPLPAPPPAAPVRDEVRARPQAPMSPPPPPIREPGGEPTSPLSVRELVSTPEAPAYAPTPSSGRGAGSSTASPTGETMANPRAYGAAGTSGYETDSASHWRNWLLVAAAFLVLVAATVTAPLWGGGLGLDVPWNLPFVTAGPETTPREVTAPEANESAATAGDLASRNGGEEAEVGPGTDTSVEDPATPAGGGVPAEPEAATGSGEFADAPILPVSGEEFAVHVASFAIVDRAERFELDLRTRGYTVFVKPKRLPDERVWYRVYLGPYDDRSAAEEAVSTLKLNGLLTYYRVLSMQAT